MLASGNANNTEMCAALSIFKKKKISLNMDLHMAGESVAGVSLLKTPSVTAVIRDISSQLCHLGHF